MGTQGVPLNKTKSDILEAIKKGKGIVTHIAQLLDCSYETFYVRMRADPEIKAALAKAREEFDENLLDLAEHSLVRAMKQQEDIGNAISSAKYVLNNKGKSRGYSPMVQGALTELTDGLRVSIAQTKDLDAGTQVLSKSSQEPKGSDIAP